MQVYRCVKAKQARVEQYFADNKRPTLTGLAMVFDMDPADFAGYRGPDRVMRNARRRIEAYYESRLDAPGARNGSQFILKTYFGWEKGSKVTRPEGRPASELSDDELVAALMRGHRRS